MLCDITAISPFINIPKQRDYTKLLHFYILTPSLNYTFLQYIQDAID